MEPGRWIVEHVHGFNEHTVVSVVPPVFASYARIFHPAKDVDGEPVRWAEVAAANGTTTAHPVMDWGSVAGGWRTPGQPRLWHEAPEHGSLPPRTARAVAGVSPTLHPHTRAVLVPHWEGSGRITAPETYPRLPMPGREHMILFSGGIALADTRFGGDVFGMSAHPWWSEDHAWCVATDIDLMTTYLGASAACVDAVLADPIAPTISFCGGDLAPPMECLLNRAGRPHDSSHHRASA